MSEKEQAAAVEEKIVKGPLLKGIDCIYIPVSDAQKSAEWYEKYLGLNRVSPGGDVMLLGNGIWMFLLQCPEGQTSHFLGYNGVVCKAFTFETEDVATLHQSLTSSGTYVERLEDHGGCGLKFHFNDLDGNRFHVYQAQTMVRKLFNLKSGDSDWKQQYKLEGEDIDTFLARVTKSHLSHRRIVIPGYNILQKLDSKGMASLLETLHQFSLEHPQHSFEIIKRDWCPTDTDAMEPAADNREAFIVPTERAVGVIKIYGKPNFKNSPNWKERIVLQIPFFVFEIDTFFKRALEGRHEMFRQVQIINDEASVPWYLMKIDPDAVRELKLAVEQFNQEHPEHAIELIE